MQKVKEIEADKLKDIMSTRIEIEAEFRKMLNKEYTEKFTCINERAGICQWMKNRGQGCSCSCERYYKCFSCFYVGKCNRVADSMECDRNVSLL